MQSGVASTAAVSRSTLIRVRVGYTSVTVQTASLELLLSASGCCVCVSRSSSAIDRLDHGGLDITQVCRRLADLVRSLWLSPYTKPTGRRSNGRTGGSSLNGSRGLEINFCPVGPSAAQLAGSRLVGCPRAPPPGPPLYHFPPNPP